MAIGLNIKPSAGSERRLQSAFERISRTAGDARAVLGRIGLFVRRNAQRLLRQRERTWGPMTLRLSRSIAMLVERASVKVGSNLKYAAIQQLGGEVFPTRRYLAIPATPQLRRRGVWPRDLPRESLRWHPAAEIRIGSHSWTGPALLKRSPPATKDAAGRKKQPKDAGQVMFALLKSVRIKGRPYLVFDQPAQAFALAEFGKAFRRGWGRGPGAAGGR